MANANKKLMVIVTDYEKITCYNNHITEYSYSILHYITCITTWFPPGLEIGENLEKWEGIFQSGKSQGILSRLEKSGKSQGILPKILEKQENLNKKMFFVKVREFYTKCWKISGFEKITVSRSYLILFSITLCILSKQSNFLLKM